MQNASEYRGGLVKQFRFIAWRGTSSIGAADTEQELVEHVRPRRYDHGSEAAATASGQPAGGARA